MTVTRLQKDLLVWYRKNARVLPWRETIDPYAIWVSEIMLQQTQVETVIPYYRRFIKTLPDVRALAQAGLSAVLKLWEGLGYYARPRNLHKAAGMIVENLRGSIPSDYCSLKELPGIGEYTAAAIASIAFGESVAVLDGNAKRVYARWIALERDLESITAKNALRRIAGKSLYEADPGTWNQAVMELGATVCVPKVPRCSACPVNAGCLAFKKEITERIPRRKKRKPLPHFQVTAGVIWHQGALLIARRKEEGLLGGLWEFPGGKLEDGETLQECLERELAEELEIKVEVGARLTEIKHAYTHFRITLHAFNCAYISGPPRAIGCAEWRWIQPAQLDEFAFPRADRKIIHLLQQERS